eukprot:6193942-Pleurochrysis_carterae.AAC.1
MASPAAGSPALSLSHMIASSHAILTERARGARGVISCACRQVLSLHGQPARDGGRDGAIRSTGEGTNARPCFPSSSLCGRADHAFPLVLALILELALAFACVHRAPPPPSPPLSPTPVSSLFPASRPRPSLSSACGL